MKKKSITTKRGDDGSTKLLDNTSISKEDLKPEVYGTIDEASSFIGLARAKIDNKDITKILLSVQNHLYLINSELACPKDKLFLLKKKLSKKQLKEIEDFSSKIEGQLELAQKFIIYGESEHSALLDVARAVIRRAERRLVQLIRSEKINNEFILPYLNRLSDTLFLLARYLEKLHNIPQQYVHPE